jgi:hypothetical protein
MARHVGWDYKEGDHVVVTEETVYVPWNEETFGLPVNVTVGTVGIAQGDVDSDGEVSVVWPELAKRTYIHFLLIAPVSPDLPTKPMAPEEIEEFLKEEDPWK